MAQYRLNANPADINAGSGTYSVSYSHLNAQLNGRTAEWVEARNAEQLVALKLAHGRKVLELNALRPQHPEVTSERRTLDAVAVTATPVTRHATGCKAVPHDTLVTR